MSLSVLKNDSGIIFHYVVFIEKHSTRLVIFVSIAPYFNHK